MCRSLRFSAAECFRCSPGSGKLSHSSSVTLARSRFKSVNWCCSFGRTERNFATCSATRCSRRDLRPLAPSVVDLIPHLVRRLVVVIIRVVRDERAGIAAKLVEFRIVELRVLLFSPTGRARTNIERVVKPVGATAETGHMLIHRCVAARGRAHVDDVAAAAARHIVALRKGESALINSARRGHATLARRRLKPALVRCSFKMPALPHHSHAHNTKSRTPQP